MNKRMLLSFVVGHYTDLKNRNDSVSTAAAATTITPCKSTREGSVSILHFDGLYGAKCDSSTHDLWLSCSFQVAVETAVLVLRTTYRFVLVFMML